MGARKTNQQVYLFMMILLMILFQYANYCLTERQMADGRLHRLLIEPKHDQPKYVFWSSDFHIAPIADITKLLQGFGMEVIDKSLSHHCHLKGTCAKDIKVLTQENGIGLGECPNKLRRDFFEAYKNEKQMAQVDAFLCNHACGLCEVFMPFNKSLIVIASTRYEIGRHSAERWSSWNKNLQKIAAHPRNVVAANNHYDAEYIKFFTGIPFVPVIPNYCGYINDSYNPSKSQILVGPGRGVHPELLSELQVYGQQHNVTFSAIRDLYPHFEYADLAQHKAIVLIPYQVSIMSLFEYYRMAIPMFAPSASLLTQWHLKHRVVKDRTWTGVFGNFEEQSVIPPHPSATTDYDPNDEIHEEAIQYWLQFSDFYKWPYIETFDSWDDLIRILQRSDFDQISRRMKRENEGRELAIRRQWKEILHTIFAGLPPVSSSPRSQSEDFDESMRNMYSIKLEDTCFGEQHLKETA